MRKVEGVIHKVTQLLFNYISKISLASSFNQRLTAAATASNSLAANAGRSKLSTEEFNLASDDAEDGVNESLGKKYEKNSGAYNTEKKPYNTEKKPFNSSYNNNPISNNSYNSSHNTSNNSSYNYSTSNNSYNSNTSNTSSYNSNTMTKPASASTYNTNNRITSGYSKPSTYPDNLGNNSFDRWNTSSNISGISTFPGESVELLQEQVNHLRREYEGLKQRFSELSRLRLSEPEEMLEEHKKLSELRDQAAEKTIKSLQKENEQLKKQLHKKTEEEKKELDTPETDEGSDEESRDNRENDDFMMEVEKILKIYSSFSGLKITPSPSDPLTQWHCEFSSRSGKFDFQLIYESELNRYQYIPLENSDNDNEEGRVKNLPPFLASDILITADQMQIFFWRLLDTLSKK